MSESRGWLTTVNTRYRLPIRDRFVRHPTADEKPSKTWNGEKGDDDKIRLGDILSGALYLSRWSTSAGCHPCRQPPGGIAGYIRGYTVGCTRDHGSAAVGGRAGPANSFASQTVQQHALAARWVWCAAY